MKLLSGGQLSEHFRLLTYIFKCSFVYSMSRHCGGEEESMSGIYSYDLLLQWGGISHESFPAVGALLLFAFTQKNPSLWEKGSLTLYLTLWQSTSFASAEEALCTSFGRAGDCCSPTCP
eukprot:c24045_g2_i1 orf=87-443(+)